MLAVAPNVAVHEAEAKNKLSWQKDDLVRKCPVTGNEFTLFQRRHHCRASGNVYHDKACNYKQPLPDSGLPGDERVGDPYIGLISMQQLEDMLLICNKKSELLSLLLTHWSKCNGKSALPVAFGNSTNLRAGIYPKLVRIPAPEILFKEGWTVIPAAPALPANNKRKGGKQKAIPYSDTYGLQFSIEGATRLTVYSEPGLAHDVVEERNKRRQQRQKKAEQRRKKEEKERQERKQAKDEQRELERQAQLAEKK